MQLVDMEVTEFPIGKLTQTFSANGLLDGVEEASMRDKVAQLLVKTFISYSSKDRAFLVDELIPVLAPLYRLNKLKLWHDRTIDAGSDWEKEIMSNLAEADIVLCLVSSDFINSDFFIVVNLKWRFKIIKRMKKWLSTFVDENVIWIYQDFKHP